MGNATHEWSELEKPANVRDFTNDVLRHNIVGAQEISIM